MNLHEPDYGRHNSLRAALGIVVLQTRQPEVDIAYKEICWPLSVRTRRQRMARVAPDVDALQQHGAAGDVVEADHEAQQRGLAAAAGPDDGHALARLRRDAHPPQHLPLGVVAEVHVLPSTQRRC